MIETNSRARRYTVVFQFPTHLISGWSAGSQNENVLLFNCHVLTAENAENAEPILSALSASSAVNSWHLRSVNGAWASQIEAVILRHLRMAGRDVPAFIVNSLPR